MKTSMMLWVALAAIVLLTSNQVNAVNLNWEGDSCVTVDGSFKVCKPNKKWDTQDTEDESRPVKWVLHKRDANPVIWLRYDENVKGQTAHDYAKVLKNRMVSERGIEVDSVKNSVINGRNVSMIEGESDKSDLHILVGVWRNQAKGFALECTANKGDFDDYKSQCLEAIESVKIVSESH